MDAEIRHQITEEVGYGIRDVWVDPTEAVEEVAPTTLEGVNARVTELAAVQEQDTQDIYAVIKDGRDRQTQLFQRVDRLVEDRQVHYETARLLDQEALNNMPPRRSSATARAAATAATPITAAAVKQLIEARVFVALANHETLQNSTNGHGDGSHNSDTGIRGTVRTPRECTYKDFLNCKPLTFKGTEGVVVLSQWFKKMESVFHISNCAVENQVNFQELALMVKDVHEESKRSSKYVLTITERQAEQKRKLEFNAGNNQGHQQQNKRHNTRRAYIAGPGCNKCKRSAWLVTVGVPNGPNGNNNNHGNSGTTQNAGTFYECGVQGHFKRDYRSEEWNRTHVTTKETEDKLGEKRLEDVPIVRDFPAVFPEDLSGLPPTQQVEFQIDLMLGVAL
ncbi:hypothetical protein Tco_0373303 [Tanacetum coccineum]